MGQQYLPNAMLTHRPDGENRTLTEDQTSSSFLEWVLSATADNPENPVHGAGFAYVCCFSADKDELTQWERYGRKGQSSNWGYAIAFDQHLAGVNSILFKVIYSLRRQEAAAKVLARATLDFYLAGLSGDRLLDRDKWRADFFEAWDGLIYPLVAAVKDSHWERENEYRIYYNGRGADLHSFGFKQRNSMLSRYFMLRPPQQDNGHAGLLPIREIMIGPGNHPAFTKVNLELLLLQKGYHGIPITFSRVDLQNP